MNSVIRKIADVVINKILVWNIDMKYFEKLKPTNQKNESGHPLFNCGRFQTALLAAWPKKSNDRFYGRYWSLAKQSVTLVFMDVNARKDSWNAA
jgi:hypothetical protein